MGLKGNRLLLPQDKLDASPGGATAVGSERAEGRGLTPETPATGGSNNQPDLVPN